MVLTLRNASWESIHARRNLSALLSDVQQLSLFSPRRPLHKLVLCQVFIPSSKSLAPSFVGKAGSSDYFRCHKIEREKGVTELRPRSAVILGPSRNIEGAVRNRASGDRVYVGCVTDKRDATALALPSSPYKHVFWNSWFLDHTNNPDRWEQRTSLLLMPYTHFILTLPSAYHSSSPPPHPQSPGRTLAAATCRQSNGIPSSWCTPSWMASVFSSA